MLTSKQHRQLRQYNRIGLTQQLQNLRQSVQSGNGQIERHATLVWEYPARPSPMGWVYQIGIRYRLGKLPQTYVLDPSIQDLAGDREIPHLYSQDKQQLCLFYPRHDEWNETMWLSASVALIAIR
ncbi:hypothetical protein BOW52_07815 [Solemya elarraichensis gill symbiont]|uniref:Type II CBASS E2 protein domain-containing protein n=1 Tax=Solemya elarraichensis gill symbiont TaxID=1918949 RepID=A0A1T2L1X9_9GAMM|nr:hypothetical protein BOW52_07815 [Solemya elarraichensis gill symbiont]